MSEQEGYVDSLRQLGVTSAEIQQMAARNPRVESLNEKLWTVNFEGDKYSATAFTKKGGDHDVVHMIVFYTRGAPQAFASSAPVIAELQPLVAAARAAAERTGGAQAGR